MGVKVLFQNMLTEKKLCSSSEPKFFVAYYISLQNVKGMEAEKFC